MSSLPDWQFFITTEDAWRAMHDAVKKAEREILCEQYILRADDAGKEFIETLITQAERGVGVQVILDMVGSVELYLNTPLRTRMEQAGISLSFWNPVRLWRIDTIFSWFFRDHRKILVIDECVGFVGGVGFRGDMRQWKDIHVKIEGDVVNEMRTAFLEMWARTKGKRFMRKKTISSPSKHFTFLTNAPSLRRHYLTESMMSAIRNATHSISITNPYFIPNRKLERALRLAAHRGVDVRILLPASSNHPFADLASRSSFTPLLLSGVKLFAYQGLMHHGKAMVVDDTYATVGSMNLDSLSLHFNYEANLVASDPTFVATVSAFFEDDCRCAEEITMATWIRRGLKARMLERIARVFRKLL